MADYPSSTEVRRPAVLLLAVSAGKIDLQPVFWGLEEEGIPLEQHEATRGEAVVLAKEAAHMSPLNVGIGVSGVENKIVLHHRDLPADQPLFVIDLRSAPVKELRRLGMNAARLVKAEPLLLKDDVVPDLPPSPRAKQAAPVSDELVERIVQSVLAEMAKARGTLWKETASV